MAVTGMVIFADPLKEVAVPVAAPDKANVRCVVNVAAEPDVSCVPTIFTPGRLILEVPSKLTPPMVRAVFNLRAVAAEPVSDELTAWTAAMFAICKLFVPVAAVGTVGVPVNAGLTACTLSPVPVEVVTPVPPRFTASTPTVAAPTFSVVIGISMFALPSKFVGVPVTAPEIDTVRGVASFVAEDAFPVTGPIMEEAVRVPVASISVNLPVEGVVAPIGVELITPPEILTALAACSAIVPIPKFVLAFAAVTAPVHMKRTIVQDGH